MIVDIRADQSRLNAARAEPPIDAAPLPSPAEAQHPIPYATLLADDETDQSVRPWLAPVIAGVLVVGWLGALAFYVLDHHPMMAPGDLFALSAAAAAGPALVGIGWLLILRTSRAEARRFGHAAEAMRAEAGRLEQRIAVVTDVLAANRAELAAQIDQLATIGDAAGERIGLIGRTLSDEIGRADDHAHRLSEAAAAAQASVGVLLASLPRTRADTEELTGALDSAGQLATRHVEALATHLVALAERGRDAEAAAGSAAGTLAARLDDIGRASDAGATRLEGAAGTMAATVEALLGRTADTLDDARIGIDRQGEAMLAMVSAHQGALDTAARTSADALAARIDGVETAIERLAGRLAGQREAGEALVADLEGGLNRVSGQMDALHSQGVERSQLLAASISALGGSANAMTEALRAGEAMANRTIGTTETLLIALDSAAREIDETLPDALTRLDLRIAQSKGVVVQAKPELLALVTAAESTHDAIEAIAGVIHDQRRTLEQLSTNLLDTLSTGRAKADALGQMFDETLDRSHRFAEEAAPKLIEALLRVRETAAAAADHARSTLASVIPEASSSLGAAAAEAMSAAASDTVGRQIDAIAEASDAAVAAATRATERLAAQVRQLTEQTAIVEARIEDERSERENADRDNLSRRVSLLIESLNSASIDITRAFAPDIADSAWAAYLKGDRGVFTRRAVRILDTGEARDVARLYDGDVAFRDQVNRYIHDFEAMLRQILAQRDGSPLGVTLLSSDMGKLYVSLAQAIERLR